LVHASNSVATGITHTTTRRTRFAGQATRLYCVVNNNHNTPIGATDRYCSFEMTMRTSRSPAIACSPLVKLHHAMTSIIHPNAVPPGTPRRVRAIIAAQIDRPLDANSTAACTVVVQDTSFNYQPKSRQRRSTPHQYQRSKHLAEVMRLG
jgi:hypothetical protein